MKSIKTMLCILLSTVFVNFITVNRIYSKDYPMENPRATFTAKLNGIEEYKLSNGLKILLKENHSIPLVTFSIWYKVGSRNENTGIFGLAHFLEHMMFKGTKNYKKGEISEIIQRHGGVFNAFTSQDFTAYYETISPKHLEEAIKIESDRIKNSILDENEFTLERTVVLSELEGDLNSPAILLDQKVRELAYETSPYKHPTIGYEEDLKKMTPDIMRDFYKKYYNPNNATVTLAGDFNKRGALNLISKYFGNIKNEDYKFSDIPRDEKQLKEKRVTVKRAGSFKILQIAYHMPDIKDKDIYPLNIIEEILIKGRKSRLNKALVEAGLATEIYGGAESNTDPGLFYIVVSLTPKANHKKVEKIVFNEINKLIDNPPSETEIIAAKNRIKANYLFNLDGTFNQAANLGYFETINNWQQSLRWTDEVSKVTINDISAVLKKYFTKNNRTIGYFIPKLRKGEKYEPQSISLSKTHHYKTISENQTNLDKTTSTNKYNFKFQKRKLTDGSTLLIYNNIDLPITYISGVIKGGTSLLPKKDESNCIIISRTLEKGSKSYTKENIENLLDNTGSSISFDCDEESFKFNVNSLNENTEKTVDLLTDLILNPTFPKKEIDLEKEKLVAEIIESKDNTAEIARRRFNQLIYPEDHPYYSYDFKKDIELIKDASVNSLKYTHDVVVKNKKAIISITSNLNSKDLNTIIKRLEEKLFSANTKKDTEVRIPNTLLREAPKTESIFVKDKMQSDVFLGHAGDLKRTDPDFYKINIANYILGGSALSSRLSKNIRDNSGLVYHIHSYINATNGKGEFGIYFGSNNNNVDKAIPLVQEELNNFVKNGITEEELKGAKNSLIDSFVSRNLSSYRSIASTLAGIEFYNLGENYINDYPKIINSLSLNEINAAIKKYIHPNKLNISIAGEYNKK